MEKVSGTKGVFFRFYILCENFSKIGSIIKKIPKFQSDPLNNKLIFSYSSTQCHRLVNFTNNFQVFKI